MALSPEEETKLLEMSDGHLRDIIVIALNTGMRQGEILGLRWDWIDFQKNFISIPQTNTKSRKERKVPINPFLRVLLKERRFATGSKEFVFPSPKAMTRSSRQAKEKHLAWVKRSFKTACKKAGIENLRFHDLRHNAATRLVEAGIPLHAIAKLLGHSTVRVTERYSHPEESVQKAVDILGKFTQNHSQNCSQETVSR